MVGGFRTKADVSDDGVVTFEEFFAAVKAFTDDALGPAGGMNFVTFAANGDGSISSKEYRRFPAIYRLTARRPTRSSGAWTSTAMGGSRVMNS
ncbi:MAG: hypothetical protein QOD83_1674 [Solirubrobacteraceae bacterium]|nr:hypothetical protein [Solirubrobacteraceae bacterium]